MKRSLRLAPTARQTHRSSGFRRGVAAVEMAMVLPLLLSLLMGLWEVGRYVMVQDILDSSSREGARMAASGDYFSSNNFNDPNNAGATLTLSSPSTNTSYELQQKVMLYLQGNGITTTGMTVTVTNTTQNWTYTWVQGGTSSGSGYDPSAAASQLDQLVVTVTLPYKNVACSPLSFFISQSATFTATSTWLSLTDVPLTVSATIPTQPIGASDPLP